MNHRAKQLIDHYEMIKHPEGGYYGKAYRSEKRIHESSYSGSRVLYSSIYFLLEGSDFSSWHRLKTDEIWHLYEGDALEVHMINPEGAYQQTLLEADSPRPRHQLMIPAGTWFAGEMVLKKGYTLIGCTLSPGFEFEDFEMANANYMLSSYPQYSDKIRPLLKDYQP